MDTYALDDLDPDGRAEMERCHRRAEGNSMRHLVSYYRLLTYIGMPVKYGGRPGELVGHSGQYVKVLLEGGDEPVTCHPTSSTAYPHGTQVGPDPDERFAHLVRVTA
ncbi:hypothetical protein ACIRQQ_46410 [Streptomyces fuscichromogenes]|uniref:hypothetical protein n=1 Tax=Streptomyces fuscichromogenes TaxID=1324013 RepID=UPI00381F42B0